LQCVTVRCSALQCVAVRCSVLRVLQCVAVHCVVLQEVDALQKQVLVCCNVLRCVAWCCDALKCVAACCSMLQRVADCCSTAFPLKCRSQLFRARRGYCTLQRAATQCKTLQHAVTHRNTGVGSGGREGHTAHYNTL